MPDLLPISRYTKFVPFTRTVLVAAALKVVVMALSLSLSLSLFTGVNTVAPRRKAPRNLRSSGVGDSSNFDLVAETTDPQNLLLFADRIGDGDNWDSPGRSTEEKRTTACLTSSPSWPITVSTVVTTRQP